MPEKTKRLLNLLLNIRLIIRQEKQAPLSQATLDYTHPFVVFVHIIKSRYSKIVYTLLPCLKLKSANKLGEKILM